MGGCHEVASTLTKIKKDVYTETNNVGELRDALEQSIQYYKEADKAKDISLAAVKLNGSSNIPIDQFSKTDNVLKKELDKLLKFIDDLKQALDSINTSKFCESTKDFLKMQEGIWWSAVKTQRPDGSIVYSIGYGNDFTEESAPDLYEKYVVNGEKLMVLMTLQMMFTTNGFHGAVNTKHVQKPEGTWRIILFQQTGIMTAI